MRPALLLALAGCMLASAATALAASALTGTYVTTVKGKRPAQLNGVWAMAIASNGDYAIQKQGVGLLIKGHAVVSGKKIAFGRETGPAACKGAQARGVYTWSLAGKKLTLKPVRDACPGRRAVLTSPLTKVR